MRKYRKRRAGNISIEAYQNRSYTSLKKSLENYKVKLREVESEIAEKKLRYEQEKEIYKKVQLDRILHVSEEDGALISIQSKLKDLGLIGSLLLPWKRRLLVLKEKEIHETKHSKLANLPLPKRPNKDYRHLYSYYYKYKDIINAIEHVLPEAKKKYDKEMKINALAKAYVDESRDLASGIKKQLKKYKKCPYCDGDYGDNAHADHIHPVSAGGLSVEENMVFVCSDCNLKKSNLTLREFCIRNKINRDVVENRLAKIGKRV